GVHASRLCAAVWRRTAEENGCLTQGVARRRVIRTPLAFFRTAPAGASGRTLLIRVPAVPLERPHVSTCCLCSPPGPCREDAAGCRSTESDGSQTQSSRREAAVRTTTEPTGASPKPSRRPSRFSESALPLRYCGKRQQSPSRSGGPYGPHGIAPAKRDPRT